jgi:hypothetical protein
MNSNAGAEAASMDGGAEAEWPEGRLSQSAPNRILKMGAYRYPLVAVMVNGRNQVEISTELHERIPSPE